MQVLVNKVSVLVFRNKVKCIGAIYVLLTCLYYLMHSKVFQVRISTTCSLDESVEFINQLCHNYTKQYVTGSFCKPLCLTKEVQFTKCLSHKNDDVILLAEWLNHGTVVLKADSMRRVTEHAVKMPHTYSTLFTTFTGIHNISLPATKRILSECDINSDGLFTAAESLFCLHMGGREEVLDMFILSGNPAIPALYGTCGNLMAVEYASTDPLVQLPVTKEYRSWKFRAKIAIALIEMIENVEDTKYGTLYLCDFQRSNFGFTEDNGHYISKAIDNDISIFKDDLLTNLKFEMNNTCKSDSECNFLHCLVPCDHNTGKCSGKMVDNNLKMLCRIFLRSETNLFYMGLLWEPPSIIREELETLLNECVDSADSSMHMSRKLAQELKNLLQLSIQ